MVEKILKRQKTLTHLPKRPPVTIEFQDISYTVPQWKQGESLKLVRFYLLPVIRFYLQGKDC